MALKSTVYRMQLHVSDMHRGHYAQYPLTLARHPSETAERLMMRVLAFALYAEERLRFGAGLSDAEEPDLLLADYSGGITLWIEVGLPEPRWIQKALSKAERVVVLAFGSGVARWLKALDQHFPERAGMKRLEIIHARATDAALLDGLAERNATISCSIEDDNAWLTGSSATAEIALSRP